MTLLLKILSVGVLLAGALFWSRHQVDPSPYYYDESDYLYAVSRGIAANWTDTPAFTPLDLIRVGLGQGRDPSQRTSVSEWIRESGDMNSYRHWHGPAYFYALMPLQGRSEAEVRGIAARLILALGILVTFFGVLWVQPGRSSLYPALLAAALVGWTPTTLVTMEVAPHVLFSVLCLACLFCIARLRLTGERRLWYAALVLAGIAFCTMAITFALVMTLMILAWTERRLLQWNRGVLLRSLGAFLLPVLLLWPGGLLKLTFLKSYMAMVYLAVFRPGAWGDITFAQTWINRFLISPVDWILLAAAVLLFLVRPQLPARRVAMPFLLFGVVMLFAVARVNAPGPRYMIPFFPPLLVFAGWIIGSAVASLSNAARLGALASLLALIAWNTQSHTRTEPVPLNQHTVAVLDTIRRNGWSERRLLVPQDYIPFLHYYFPTARLRGYLNAEDLERDLERGGHDVLIEPGFPVRGRALAQ